jgi:alpha-glucoside transport system substrate-binding protein
VIVGVGGDESQQNLDALGEKYGVRISTRQVSFEITAAEQATQELPGDIFVIGASELPKFSTAHPLVDLRPFVDETTMLGDYGAHLVSLSRIGENGEWPSDSGPIHGVFVGLQPKSLIWTNEPEFTDLGYEAPSDWASFMSLANEMVADGQTPFCLGIESANADGWPVTDWVETVVLRTAGPDFYDQWMNHLVPFDDPLVVNAIRTVGEMVHTPGFLDTTPAQAADRLFIFALDAFFTNSECLMTPWDSSLPGIVDAAHGNPVDTFGFPAFGLGHDDALVGGGGIAVAVTDRPEVRKVMAALASADFGAASAQLEWPGDLPVNARFDTTKMINPVVEKIAGELQAGVRSNELRLDASDAMPAEIGQGAFWAGMVRLFREGSPENLDQLSQDIAREIEAAWVELEQSG